MLTDQLTDDVQLIFTSIEIKIQRALSPKATSVYNYLVRW